MKKLFSPLFKGKKRRSEHREDPPDNLVQLIKNEPGLIPDKIIDRVRKGGMASLPSLTAIWSELSLEKQNQLWEIWQEDGLIDGIVKDLGSKYEDKHLLAAQVLKEIKHEKLLLPLINALESSDQFVPARVAEVLLSYGQPGMDLIMARLPELSEEGKYLAISILEEFGDPKAIPPLLKELAHTAPKVRMKAVEALGELGNYKVATSIIEMLQDDEWEVRSRAAKALGKIKDSQAIPALQRLLEDETWWVRENAHDALKKILAAREDLNE
jgi:HEAT repeat protein